MKLGTYWIARDPDGDLYAYSSKPTKNSTFAWGGGDWTSSGRILHLPRTAFKDIKHTDAPRKMKLFAL